MSEEPRTPGQCPACGGSTEPYGKVCPHCGHDPQSNSTDQRVCAACGAPLQAWEPYCPTCGRAARSQIDGGRQQAAPATGCAMGCLVLLVLLMAVAASCAFGSTAASDSLGGTMVMVGRVVAIGCLAGIVAIVVYLSKAGGYP